MDDRALARYVVSGQLEEPVVGTAGTNRLDWVCLSPRILVLHSWIKVLSRIEWRFSGPFAIPQTSAWESRIINDLHYYEEICIIIIIVILK